jgi:hypothetical protein
MKNQQSPRRDFFLYLAVRLNELLDDPSNDHLVARVFVLLMAIAGLIALGVGHAAQALFDLNDHQAMWVMAGTLAVPAVCAAAYYGLKSD